jgi:hypothetical protein
VDGYPAAERGSRGGAFGPEAGVVAARRP